MKGNATEYKYSERIGGEREYECMCILERILATITRRDSDSWWGQKGQLQRTVRH